MNSPEIPLMYWGYLRGDGEMILMPYKGMEAIHAACNQVGTKYVRGPFIACTLTSARAILHAKMQAASLAAQRRREEEEGKSAEATV
jgi:hypothetical protein